MTIFLAYTFSSSPLSLLTIMQAEIPGQIQDGYDAVPNFFHEIHQVRTPHFSLTSFIIAFSDFLSTSSTAPWVSQKPQVHYDENSSFDSSEAPPAPPTTLLPSKLTYDAYSPCHPIIRCHLSSTFL
ncbi:uncharacterized protein F5891DRAFT_1184530 [Suillus fuscotomentosus]|uniref:Uncharacterized protein n=1 Tax=Suillus fuscotomentosus TaxID=1912939 RepID=A0AAD4EDV7_9AGAM|nr:uncharacterized protein F5891DRAFT_1184530 [Suillus fuscotomentosus]KAG1904325.1 hypothetical protein F5891DRAFT_1184530 [Suillus fuscotomentosus]